MPFLAPPEAPASRRSGARRRPTGRLGPPRVADVALVLLAWLLSQPGVGAHAGPAGLAVQLFASAVASIALLWRRERTFAVLAVNLVCVLSITCYSPHPVLPGAFAVALYSTGRHLRARLAWPAAAVAGLSYSGVLVALHSMDMAILSRDAGGRFSTAVVFAGLLLIPILLLVAVGQVIRLRHELKERSKEALATAAVRAERARIARELHDVVVHHVTTMSVLIGGARVTLRNDCAAAEDALTRAETSGRDAVEELRHLLHVLRAEDARRPHTEDHAAGVDALPNLVRRLRETGQKIGLDVMGRRFTLPASTEHAVYRIVQEALTNTRKHAGGADASVVVRYRPDSIEVRVSDSGPAVRKPGTRNAAMTGGLGLIGMAERVALCGGELHAGPTAEGGFHIHARIPVDKGARRR
ncbi:sensor histidine kinase [Microbispora sp. ZYX-F-249]|uniref:histidine kinase n=1 Tax=Microbispora maris TaxID=3144104 RepID=A0ABV0AIR5_9ACTN